MRVTILGSGSEGNALLLESRTTAIVVDAGLSYRRLVQRLDAVGRRAPRELSAIVVTHSHGDHAAHASTYGARFGCPVRAAKETIDAIGLRPSIPRDAFSVGRPFRVGDIWIRSRRIPHDAPQVALRFETAENSVGLVTDLGHVPRGLERFLSDCDTLLLESNHDRDMLASGPYPAPLKRRVGGRLGHLSNAEAGDLLSRLDHAPREVVLMHLSETNNAPHLARCSAEAALGHRGTRIRVADQKRPLEIGAVRQEQLQLAL